MLFVVQYQADSEPSILMAFAKLLRMRLKESAIPPDFVLAIAVEFWRLHVPQAYFVSGLR